MPHHDNPRKGTEGALSWGLNLNKKSPYGLFDIMTMRRIGEVV